MIKEILTNDDLLHSVDVIRGSFKTVADEFNLTMENCPAHPSFITYENVIDLKAKGLNLFGLFIDDIQAGFMAIEKVNDDLFYIEKLSVLPQYRHNSYGTNLVQFAFDFIIRNRGKTVSIGIIDKHDVLKEWYKKFGFQEIKKRNYKHLPFTVCIMEKPL